MTKDIQKYADVAMFKAQEINAEDGPRVFLLSCNNDPLGSVAAAAKAYIGEFVESLAEITDEERRYYLEQIQKTALAMPLEAVNFQFRITGVTRGFTHQMVRQRTAAYSQESTRFAVKDTVPVGRPPSLEGTVPWSEWLLKCAKELYPPDGPQIGDMNRQTMVRDFAVKHATEAQHWRKIWDEAVSQIEEAYNDLVNSGMPAEDARGLLPTNLLTQINYHTNLRNFIDEGGKRLCTQAQFEWRIVFSKMMEAIRTYGKTQTYPWPGERSDFDAKQKSSQWQFDAIADIFRPVCYLRGKCQFNADFDRYCSIKGRVERYAENSDPSSMWVDIKPEEWLLDPKAARVSQ